MKIALITDAWFPQINGVVTTLRNVCEQLREFGHQVEMCTPDQFRNWPCPGYPEIRLALGCGRRLSKRLDALQPDAIHICTEGPLGCAARTYCRRRGISYTTSFHTRFAEYLEMRSGIPASWTYCFLRWFHSSSDKVMAATPSLVEELRKRGFQSPVLWSRGVNTDIFKPRDKGFLDGARPICLYAGRVAVEKNIEAFLRLDLPGTIYIVGDGPQRSGLEAKYPEVRFAGYHVGEDLAHHIAAADVFVFPSLTDTFGLVMLEALACGVPVAAFPVQGPADVILSDKVGCLNQDLRQAVLEALKLSGKDCRAYSLAYAWEKCARQFEGHLVRIVRSPQPRAIVWWRRYS